MIKFFRKIRYDLMGKNKTGMYLKYAIGEIILVVIGILIALSINNWNEGRKSIKMAELLLLQVNNELASNINKSNGVIAYYRGQDSLLYKVLNKKITYDDYKSNRRYSGLIQGVEVGEITDDAFNNLIDFEGQLTQKQDSMVSKLKVLYGVWKPRVDKMDEIVLANLFEIVAKFKNEKEWFYDREILGDYPDEMIEYFLSDPFYLNEVTHFQKINLGNHNRYTVIFRENALSLYNELTDHLKLDRDALLLKNSKAYEHYVGTYNSEDITIKIFEENDNFRIRRINNKDSTVLGTSDFYPYSKKYFSVARAFGQLIFDENNEPTGFMQSYGSIRTEYIKVK